MGKDTKVTIQSKGNQKVSEIQKKKKRTTVALKDFI